MRSIKFRYIVKHKYNDNIEKKIYTLRQIEERPLHELSPVFSSDYEILSRDQYIGQKDSNEIEVYDGDILKIKHVLWNEGDEEISEVCWYGDGEWSYPAFDLNGQRLKGYFEGNVLSEIFAQSGEYSIEVIGNLIENPELLSNTDTSKTR